MEIELRAKIKKDINGLKKVLEQKGAEYISEDTLIDYYYGDLGLFEKLKHSFVIRIRVKDNKIILNLKSPTKIDGVYDEHEKLVDDLDYWRVFFKTMGLEEFIVVNKKRFIYKMSDINICIDEIKDIGNFIELEKISNVVDKKDLYTLMQELNIPKEDIFEKGFITNIIEKDKHPFSKWIKN